MVQDAMDRLMQSDSFPPGSGNRDISDDDPEDCDPGGHHDGVRKGPRDNRGPGGRGQGRGGESGDKNTGGSQRRVGNRFSDIQESVAFKVCLFG